MFEKETADISRLHPVQDPARTASDRDAALVAWSREAAPREISQRKLIGTMCCWELGHEQKVGEHAEITGIFVYF
jgi:hypothetical protein